MWTVKSGKFWKEEKQAVLLEKREWSAWTCLSWKKKSQKKPQHSFMKHFFSKVFALEHFFLLTHAYLSKQTFIPFYYGVWGSSFEVMPYRRIQAVTVTSFLWHNKWLTQPQGAEHRAVTAWWGPFTCYLWDSFSRGKNTELYFRVQIKFWVLDPVENVCLLVAAELEYDDLHLETFVSFIIWCYWPTTWLHNNHIKKLIFSSSSDCMSFWSPNFSLSFLPIFSCSHPLH